MYRTIYPPEEEIIEFKNFGFKMAIVQELMYDQKLLQPQFDLYEFVDWYDKREIDIEKEGYEPIPEVTQYFKDLPVPKRLAKEVTEIYQDGGNEIYLQLLRFGAGWEDYADQDSTDYMIQDKSELYAYYAYGIANKEKETIIPVRYEAIVVDQDFKLNKTYLRCMPFGKTDTNPIIYEIRRGQFIQTENR